MEQKSHNRSSSGVRASARLACAVRRVDDEQVAGLAFQDIAERGESREAHGAGAVVLEHRKVDDTYADALGEVGEGEPTLVE